MEVIKLPSELTRNEALNAALSMIESVKEGYSCPLKLQVQMKFLESVIKKVKDSKEFKEDAFVELANYEKNPEILGAKVSSRNSTRYEYCEQIKRQEEEFNEHKQEFERFVKNCKDVAKKLKDGKTFPMVNPVTGEMVTISQPKKIETKSIVVTLK